MKKYIHYPLIICIYFYTAYASSSTPIFLDTAAKTCFKETVVLCGVRFRESEQNNLHKYYLSVSNVIYNPKVKALQMTTRFFIDDLEDVLSERAEKKLVINNDKNLENLKQRLSSYLEKKLEITTDGAKRNFVYLGGEIDNDQVILYIEIPVNEEPSSVTMKFTALQELFEDQKNMVHFKLKGQRSTLLMTKEKQTDYLKLS